MKDTVSTILLSSDNCFILQQRDDKPDIKYSGMVMNFGGSIEQGEEPIDAIVREVEEELGIRLLKEDFSYLKKRMHKNHFDTSEHFAYLFIAKNINRNLLVLKEGKRIIYIPPNAIQQSPIISERTKEELGLGILK